VPSAPPADAMPGIAELLVMAVVKELYMMVIRFMQ
jgi:hypothetical protein